MYLPPTPSSSRSQRSWGSETTLAPLVSPKRLPETPPPMPGTPAAPATPRHLQHQPPPPAPRLLPVALPRTPSFNPAYGLPTPPMSPARPPCSLELFQLHDALAAPRPRVHFNLKDTVQSIQYHPSCSPNDCATAPAASQICINVVGVFNVIVSTPGRAVTVADVVGKLAVEMGRAASPEEQRFFSGETQRSVGAAASSRSRAHGSPSVKRRVDYLGSRVVFGGLQVTQASDTIVFCDLRLA
ncbi:uncharacterized protein LAESUDRAFT_812396 [Laetiporus sulphureus 93-53]|uniref:DUF6699 domain-containing protein n=1 Tax=Laetiporus sulphureus 93-53 TaxID=1314785 RepID=A0A165EHC1_9APHY|nr:uncharacterized protein LAESUDRAFT_812396 [Laetiporus sulphureus 93-53]KZT07054.1 hypothetical protein LAESUDRAFT_812396 [Laetiporus sulphureus 93-53]